MDEETIGKVKGLLLEAADEYGLDLEVVRVFGSRARDDYKEGSDVDILVVSKDFMDVAWNKRPGPFYEEWDYEELPDPEFICLTPEEFREKKKRKPNIVRTAVEEGTAIA